MTVFPQLEHALVEAATRQRSAASRNETRAEAVGRQSRRGVAVVICALLISASALAAAGGVWHPRIGDGKRGRPTVSESDLNSVQLAHFGVLRRAQTAADRSTRVRYALRFLDPAIRGVHTDAIRLLSTADGGFVLVPVDSSSASSSPGLCLFELDGKDGGGVSCWTTGDVLAGWAMAISVTPRPQTAAQRAALKRFLHRHPHGGALPAGSVNAAGTVRYSGLVPDEVAAVRLNIGGHTRTVAARNNFYTATIAPRKRDRSSADPSRRAIATWLDRRGRSIDLGP